MDRAALTEDVIYGTLQDCYLAVKGIARTMTRQTELLKELDLDSIDALEIITLIEDRLGVEILDEITSALDRVVTVGDFIDEVAAVCGVSASRESQHG